MRKQYNQNGFTFIEVITALLLFTILLGILWQLFSSAFSSYIRFDHETTLNDHSRIVSSFIREEMRTAEKVKITVISVTGATLYINPLSTGSNVKIEGRLKEIALYNDSLGAGIRSKERFIKMEPISSPNIKLGEGEYKLVYDTVSGTPSPISDKIQNIKVTREKDSPVVQFECQFQKKGESDERLKIRNIFSESLAYKEQMGSPGP